MCFYEDEAVNLIDNQDRADRLKHTDTGVSDNSY